MHQHVANGSSDEGLLRAFVSDGSEGAFRGLVEKYLGMVLGVARRRVGNAEIAQEVAQNVFTILVRKAKRLKARPTLAGWIHRTTVIECAEAMRRESSHRARMNAVSQQLLTEFNGREVWAEALPLLDEGIDALSAAEREVVMLRFFERKSFREIGVALGSSEDAAQKRCERALLTLNGFLKKRGVRVSVAILGTGLGSALVQECGAAMVGAMTREALGAVSTFEAKILILKAIEAMTRTKLNTAILVAAALSVPIAMQWAENTRLRAALRDERGAGVNAGNGHGTGVDRHAPVPSSAVALRSPSKVERDFLPGGQKSGAKEADRGADVQEWKHALFMSDPLQRSQRLAELLGRLRAEDGPAIAAAFEEARGAGLKFAEDHRLFLRAWGKIGGATAVEHAVKQNGDGSDEAVAALGGWASSAPALARAWVEDLPESETKESLVYGLLDGWSTTDFQAAAAYAESRPASAVRDRFRELLLQRALRVGGIAAAQNWVDRIPEDEQNRDYKRGAFGDVVQAMLYRDPAAAARWISELEGRGYVGTEAVTNTAVKLAESSPTGALEWLTGLKPGKGKEVARSAGAVVQTWAKDDPQAAGRWLQGNAEHPFYGRMALSYVRTVVDTDRSAAKAWAETIREEETRAKALAALEPRDTNRAALTFLSYASQSMGEKVTLLDGISEIPGNVVLTDLTRTGTGELGIGFVNDSTEVMVEKMYGNPHPAGAKWKNCGSCHQQ